MDSMRVIAMKLVTAGLLSIGAVVLLSTAAALTPAPAAADDVCSGWCAEFCIFGWGERTGRDCIGPQCCSAAAICCQ